MKYTMLIGLFIVWAVMFVAMYFIAPGVLTVPSEENCQKFHGDSAEMMMWAEKEYCEYAGNMTWRFNQTKFNETWKGTEDTVLLESGVGE